MNTRIQVFARLLVLSVKENKKRELKEIFKNGSGEVFL